MQLLQEDWHREAGVLLFASFCPRSRSTSKVHPKPGNEYAWGGFFWARANGAIAKKALKHRMTTAIAFMDWASLSGFKPACQQKLCENSDQAKKNGPTSPSGNWSVENQGFRKAIASGEPSAALAWAPAQNGISPLRLPWGFEPCRKNTAPVGCSKL